MYERILIATDGSDCSAQAVREGVRLAQSNGSLVTLLYVMDDSTIASDAGDPSAAKSLRRDANTALHQAHGIASELSVMVTDRIAQGLPIIEIVREAENFDLLVMGSHGRGRLQRMVVGSVTVGVLCHLKRPVLIVPPPDDGAGRSPAG